METNFKSEKLELLKKEGAELKNRISNGFFKLENVDDDYVSECVNRGITYTLLINEIRNFSRVELLSFFYDRVKFLITNKEMFNDDYITKRENELLEYKTN